MHSADGGTGSGHVQDTADGHEIKGGPLVEGQGGHLRLLGMWFYERNATSGGWSAARGVPTLVTTAAGEKQLWSHKK